MPKRDPSLLTPAQWRVLARMAEGEDNVAIGRALGIRPATVAVHIKLIYADLPPIAEGRSKRAAAIAWYQTVGRALREQETR